MIKILTDTCSDLPDALIEKYHVELIPLSVIINDQIYKDRVEINNQTLYAAVEKTNTLPKTSAISVAEFRQKFEELESDLIYISLSSQLSATHNNAVIAAREFPDRDIRILDSKNLSTGIGHLVLRAAELRDQGAGLDEIENRLLEMVPRLRSSFMIDQLDYLYLGGRCSSLQAFFGSMLKIRPIIEVRQDGSMGIWQNTRGTRKRGLSVMINEFKQHLDQIDRRRVFITQSGGAENDADYIKNELLQLADIEEIILTEASATISSHCGPTTIGILYYYK
ncbi:MAG: DegV family protein [Anaerolineaceae bacterium]|nr:DegV family protein [Anaerolineaceae bacterium]